MVQLGLLNLVEHIWTDINEIANIYLRADGTLYGCFVGTDSFYGLRLTLVGLEERQDVCCRTLAKDLSTLSPSGPAKMYHLSATIILCRLSFSKGNCSLAHRCSQYSKNRTSSRPRPSHFSIGSLISSWVCDFNDMIVICFGVFSGDQTYHLHSNGGFFFFCYYCKLKLLELMPSCREGMARRFIITRFLQEKLHTYVEGYSFHFHF